MIGDCEARCAVALSALRATGEFVGLDIIGLSGNLLLRAQASRAEARLKWP